MQPHVFLDLKQKKGIKSYDCIAKIFVWKLLKKYVHCTRKLNVPSVTKFGGFFLLF